MQTDVLTSPPPITGGTKDRVRSHTPAAVNNRIDQKMMKRIWFYATQPKQVLTSRIAELDAEWDMERALETKTAALALGGLFLGVTVNRKWLMLPAVMLGLLLQHSLTRSSPAVQALRRMGIRTRREIDAEKYALKMLRGDFDAIKSISEETHRAIEALRISRM